jgi:hypothetical protein
MCRCKDRREAALSAIRGHVAVTQAARAFAEADEAGRTRSCVEGAFHCAGARSQSIGAPMTQIRIDTVEITHLANALAAVGEKAPDAIRRALNHTGDKEESRFHEKWKRLWSIFR